MHRYPWRRPSWKLYPDSIRGQLLDSEYAEATGIPLPKVHTALSDLFERGEIARCRVTRFRDGKPVEATLCRISGYIPPQAPGRKPTK